jgi:hypothetical protein
MNNTGMWGKVNTLQLMPCTSVVLVSQLIVARLFHFLIPTEFRYILWTDTWVVAVTFDSNWAQKHGLEPRASYCQTSVRYTQYLTVCNPFDITIVRRPFSNMSRSSSITWCHTRNDWFYHVNSQVIFTGHQFRTVTHRWPSPYTGNKIYRTLTIWTA